MPHRRADARRGSSGSCRFSFRRSCQRAARLTLPELLRAALQRNTRPDRGAPREQRRVLLRRAAARRPRAAGLPSAPQRYSPQSAGRSSDGRQAADRHSSAAGRSTRAPDQRVNRRSARTARSPRSAHDILADSRRSARHGCTFWLYRQPCTHRSGCNAGTPDTPAQACDHLQFRQR